MNYSVARKKIQNLSKVFLETKIGTNTTTTCIFEESVVMLVLLSAAGKGASPEVSTCQPLTTFLNLKSNYL